MYGTPSRPAVILFVRIEPSTASATVKTSGLATAGDLRGGAGRRGFGLGYKVEIARVGPRPLLHVAQPQLQRLLADQEEGNLLATVHCGLEFSRKQGLVVG